MVQAFPLSQLQQVLQVAAATRLTNKIWNFYTPPGDGELVEQQAGPVNRLLPRRVRVISLGMELIQRET